MTTLQGQLLVANGGLFDPNFRRAVVLVADHNDEGALGVVLNRPSGVQVSEAAPAVAGIVDDDDLFLGGPVEAEAGVVLAQFGHPDDVPHIVFDSIGFVTDAAALGPEAGVTRARVFAGYAGWGPGQLEEELGREDWITDPARPEDVFTNDPGELWSEVLKRKGGNYVMLSTMPFDPSTN